MIYQRAAGYQVLNRERPAFFQAGLGVTMGQEGDGGDGPPAEYLPQSLAIFAAMSPQPPLPWRTLINDTVAALIAADLWDDYDVLYGVAAFAAQPARVNWKNPGAFTATVIGTPTFVPGQGYTGNGTDAALDTGWIPSTNGVAFTQDAAHVSAWTLTSRSVGATYALYGARRVAATANTELLPIFSPSADSTFARLNDAANGLAYVGNIQGFWVIDRPDATGTGVYLNDTTLTAPTGDASVGLPDRSMYLLATNGGSVTRPSGDNIALFSAGAALGSTKRTAAFNIFTAYLAAAAAL